MATSPTSYLEDLGLDTEDFSILNNAEEFTLTGRVINMQRGKTTPFMATINGKQFEATALLEEASLSRVTESLHTVASQGNKEIKIISGVFRPVRMNISIDLGGGNVRTLAELLYDLVNLQNAKEKKEPISFELFAKTCYRMGLPIVPLPEQGVDGSMPMLWQHFSADQDAINEIFDFMEEQGAKPAASNMNPRIIRSLIHPGKGIPVVSFEVGRSDRSQERNANKTITLPDGSTVVNEGTGFLDFVDATLITFKRGVSQRKTRSILRAELEKMASATKPKEEDIAILKAKIDVCTQLSQSWMGAWSGAQREIIVQPDQSAVYGNRIFPLNAPSGRMVLDLGEGAEKEFNFWRNQESAPIATDVVDTTSGAMGEEDPF